MNIEISSSKYNTESYRLSQYQINYILNEYPTHDMLMLASCNFPTPTNYLLRTRDYAILRLDNKGRELFFGSKIVELVNTIEANIRGYRCNDGTTKVN